MRNLKSGCSNRRDFICLSFRRVCCIVKLRCCMEAGFGEILYFFLGEGGLNNWSVVYAASLLRFLYPSEAYISVRMSLNKWPSRHRSRYPHDTQQTQETDIHAISGIWTCSPSSRSASYLRLGPRGHRYFLLYFLASPCIQNYCNQEMGEEIVCRSDGSPWSRFMSFE